MNPNEYRASTGSDNSSISAHIKKGFAPNKQERLLEFDKGNAVIRDIIEDPNTGVCYAKCVPGGKEIAATSRYLKNDKVTIDDDVFTKSPTIARAWINQGYNVATYTGIRERDVIEDNLVILDIDLKDVSPEDEPQFLAPAYLIENLCGRSLTIETRSGGLQVIFRNRIGLVSNPRLRYIDKDTGDVKDAGDTRVKHAYALFAGSYVPPDKSNPKEVSLGTAKPFKKPLPHADGLYRVVDPMPVADLTEDILDTCGLTLFSGGSIIKKPRPRQQKSQQSGHGSDTDKAGLVTFKQYSSYGRRQFKYALTLPEIRSLAASASPASIRNSEGKTLESISYINHKIFRLLQPRTDYKSRGVTDDETESAENAALAFEMRKHGFDDPDTIAKAILLYQPRDKNFDIRADGTSYLADTIAGAFDLYEFICQNDLPESADVTELQSTPTANVGDVAKGRGYSYLADVAGDDPRVTFDTWTEFPPMSPEWADIMLWRGDPRSGKSWHAVLYMAQHNSGTYITHRHEILDTIEERLAKLTESTGKTIVRLAGKSRCCPYAAEGFPVSCKDCFLKPTSGTDEDELDGIPVLYYKTYAEQVLQKYRVIDPKILRDAEPGYCPYYLLKYSEPYANYCLTVPQFVSPLTNVDGFEVSPRDYTVIDEEPTIDSFYPQTPVVFECHNYGFAEGYTKNHLISENITSAVLDIKSAIQEKNPKRVTKINRIIMNICDNILLINENLMEFSKLPYRGKKERDKLVNRIMPYLDLDRFRNLSNGTKLKVMRTVMEHLHGIKYAIPNDVLAYFQPFLYPYTPEFLSWQTGMNGRSPKQVLYLISDRTMMFDLDFKHLLVIGATESEMFVNDIRGSRTVARIDLNLFPYSKNYVFIVAEGDTARAQERLVYNMMVSQHVANRDAFMSSSPDARIVPFLVVTPSKLRQDEIVKSLSPYGRVIGLNEHDTRADVLRYYYTGNSVAFYNNGSIARGVDLPEFDTMFFMGGGFATPRITAFERQNLRRGHLNVSHRLSRIRASKISDEYTNSGMRGSPIYSMKEQSTKVLYISRAAFSCLYPSVYKEAVVIPVTSESFDKIVGTVGGLVDSITVRQAPAEPGTDCEELDSTYYIYNNRANVKSTVYTVNSGKEVTTAVESLKGANPHEIEPATQPPIPKVTVKPHARLKYYQKRDLVANSVISMLKTLPESNNGKLGQEAVINKVAKYKYVKRRGMTRKDIQNVIDYLVDTGRVVRIEADDWSTLPVDGSPPAKVYLKLSDNVKYE
jgi:hypothetical protein